VADGAVPCPDAAEEAARLLAKGRDVAVLSPTRKGPAGTYALNAALQREFNPAARAASLAGAAGGGAAGGAGLSVYHGPGERMVLFPGDPVIQLVNDYTREVFNGDLGRVVSVDDAAPAAASPAGDGEKRGRGGEGKGKGKAAAAGRGSGLRVVVAFPDDGHAYREADGEEPAPVHVVYEGAQVQEQLNLAYATTVHKAQGSEHPVVIVPVLPSHGFMLSRSLLYSALTRASELVVVVGSSQVRKCGGGAELYCGLRQSPRDIKGQRGRARLSYS
jgi:exodeoxyribonuclease V alpha subunit